MLTSGAEIKSIGDQILNHLLRGNTEDALSLTISHNLWPESLILASRISKEVYGELVLKLVSSVEESQRLSLHQSVKVLLGIFSNIQPHQCNCLFLLIIIYSVRKIRS